MSQDWNALVVGGGPAGLAAAEAAAQGGARTLLLERQSEIGYPVHTSGGSWVRDMQALHIPEHLYHSIHTIVFVSPHNDVSFHYNPAVACVVDVRGLYQHLASRAIAAGAELRLRHTVEQAVIADGKVSGVTVKNHMGKRETLRADVTIDASGFARHIGVRVELGEAVRRYGYGAEYDMYAPHYPQDTIYLIMGSQFAPRGYAWAFPRGDGRVRLGTGVIHPDSDEDARSYLDTIRRDLPQLREKLSGSGLVEYHTGLFPSEGPLRQFSRGGLLLAGDAGGHGSTLVGEGIRYAIYSGQIAGKKATEACNRGDTSAAFLASYDKQWRARFGREMEIAYLINQRIAGYSDGQWDDALTMLKRLTARQVAQAMHGNFSVGLLMGVVARNPGLLLTGSKKFIDLLMERMHGSALQQAEEV